mmetsp:Transcript_66307/g.173846  ORF Transcript_66307/g.173846 Transcript_66307/m.173846 type:complete len:238 (-) Transcript_66307:2031-2744(-)
MEAAHSLLYVTPLLSPRCTVAPLNVCALLSESFGGRGGAAASGSPSQLLTVSSELGGGLAIEAARPSPAGCASAPTWSASRNAVASSRLCARSAEGTNAECGSSASASSRASSWSWEPSSTFTPWSRTTILSLSLIVDSRCAMTKAEPFLASLSRACCTSFSFSASRDAVASSSRMTSGLRTMARAMAIRCFCPPEKLPPPEATVVMSLSGFSCRKSQATASRQACSISSSVASSRP